LCISQVEFVGYLATAEGHILYDIKVIGPHSEEWRIYKRYSEMLALHMELHAFFGESLLRFPAKRLWGNQHRRFIEARMTALERYFQSALTFGLWVAALTSFFRGPLSHMASSEALLRNDEQVLTSVREDVIGDTAPVAELATQVASVPAEASQAGANFPERLRDAGSEGDKEAVAGQSRCSICLEEGDAFTACDPCGHRAFCIACASDSRFTGSRCPICRKSVVKLLRIY